MPTNSISERDPQIEQLWFTWSSRGIDLLPGGGWRIRAASQGLSNINSDLVRYLESHYLNYTLPSGQEIDAAYTPKTAPVSLALKSTGFGESRVLVHKKYHGDANETHGAYFTHLLFTRSPSVLSAQIAIRLWKSDFWAVDDTRLEAQYQYDNLLGYVSLKELQEKQAPDPNLTSVQNALLTAIPIYLTKLPVSDPNTPQKLYIVASADVVAHIISGLVRCLPLRFIQSLTFSTYEYDLQNAGAEIVGVSPLAPFPHEFSQYNLVLDSSMPEKPRWILNQELIEATNLEAAQAFAQDAVNYLIKGAKQKQFLLLLACAECPYALSTTILLRLHQLIIQGSLDDLIATTKYTYDELWKPDLINSLLELEWGTRYTRLNHAFVEFIHAHEDKTKAEDAFKAFLIDLSSDKHRDQWQIVTALFREMVQRKYLRDRKKINLYNVLRSYPIGTDSKRVQELQEAAQVSPEELKEEEEQDMRSKNNENIGEELQQLKNLVNSLIKEQRQTKDLLSTLIKEQQQTQTLLRSYTEEQIQNKNILITVQKTIEIFLNFYYKQAGQTQATTNQPVAQEATNADASSTETQPWFTRLLPGWFKQRQGQSGDNKKSEKDPKDT